MSLPKKVENSHNFIILTVIISSILLILGAATYSFFKESREHEKNVKTQEEAESVPVIGIYDVYKKLENNEDFILLDARDASDFEVEHIPTSLNIPYDDLLNGRFHELAQNKTIIVTCYGEGCLTSQQAALFLKKEGFENIFNLAAGISGWKSAKLPTIEAGNLENPANFYKNVALNAPGLDNILTNHSLEITLVDLRSEVAFNQDHLPQAIWIPYEKLEKEAQEKLSPTKKIILYSDDETKSQKASATLYDLDFPLTFYLEGGYNAWKTYQTNKDQEVKKESTDTETP
jgi:rhodanese-related sulfurtransferase